MDILVTGIYRPFEQTTQESIKLSSLPPTQNVYHINTVDFMLIVMGSEHPLFDNSKGTLDPKSILNSTNLLSFIYIDKNRRSITLKVDERGMIPLYYAHINETFIFSTKQRGILQTSAIQPTLNTDILFELFTVGFVLPPDTLIKEIASVPIHTQVTWNGQLRTELLPPSLWSADNTPDTPGKLKEAHDTLIQIIQKNIYDKPAIGLLASGGFDSSLLTALVRQHTQKPLHLFTVLNDTQDPEYRITQQLAQSYSAENHYYFADYTTWKHNASETLAQGESEMVGILSLNAPIEYDFAKFCSEFDGILMTGDDNWITPKNFHEYTPMFYIKKFGLLSTGQFQLLFPELSKSGFLAYLKKHARFFNNEPKDPSLFITYRTQMHALVMGKLYGKIRKPQEKQNVYYLPLSDQQYVLRILKILHTNSPYISCRDVLATINQVFNIIPDARFHHTHKRWMPSPLEDTKTLALLQQDCEFSCAEMLSALGGQHKVLPRLLPYLSNVRRTRFLSALYLLNKFNDIFVRSRQQWSTPIAKTLA